MKRIVLAALVGGVALFAWESVAHMALPLGEAGLRVLDNEPTVLAALKQNIKEPGFYFFPAGDSMKPGLTGQQQQQAMENQAKLMRAGYERRTATMRPGWSARTRIGWPMTFTALALSPPTACG